MTYFRLGLCAAALSFSNCSSTAPEPPDFKLSAEALSKQYRATRKTGAVRLYANEIQTTRDEWGRETHLASGGSLLVKDSVPPIMAQASSISITPGYAEAHGKATVKKADRLYIGQDESSTIRIDGTAIKAEGPHVVRTVASEAAAAEAKARAEAKAQAKVEKANAEAEAKAQKEIAAKEKAEAQATAKAEAEALANADAETKYQAEKARADAAMKAEAMAKAAEEPPAKPKKSPSSSAGTAATKKKTTPDSKPKEKTTAAAKPSPAATKPSSPPAADKPKETPAVDRARLLNLMREPTDQ